MLEINGYGYVWLRQCINESSESFLFHFKQRLMDQYIQTWNDNVDKTSDNRFYKSIKTEFRFEDYLDAVEKSSNRKALSKIRLGSHNFMIERGRWVTPKLDINVRLCSSCQTLEDVYHCLIDCPRFKNQRKSLPSIFTEKPSMSKLVSLFKTENIAHLKKLALVCQRIMNCYDNYMLCSD